MRKEKKNAARYLLGKKGKQKLRIALVTAVAAFFAILFLLPTVLTITNSFMSSSEIAANYGKVFAT